MRAQDFVGWLVPAYVIGASLSGLAVALVAHRFGQVWLPVAGLVFGAFLVRGLLRRRREWLKTQGQPRAS